MSRETTPTALRVLILTLNLVNTDVGKTKWQLRNLVPGYSELSDSSFQRSFERDVDTLRETGLIVETINDGTDFRYCISGSSFPVSSVTFDPNDAELLVEAVSAWEGQGSITIARILSKLNAYIVQLPEEGAFEESAILNRNIDEIASHRLEGIEYLPVLVQSLENLQPVHFDYYSRTGQESRDVAPWSIVVRGRAVYLWGFDLNRWAPRLFRLSRIHSKMIAVGEPGAYEIPSDQQASFDTRSFRIKPLLWLRQGSAKLTRLHCQQPLDFQHYPPKTVQRSGWDLCWGDEDDQGMWQRLVLDDPENVVVMEPQFFRKQILSSLNKMANTELLSTPASNVDPETTNGE